MRRLNGGLRLAAAKDSSTASPIRRGFVPSHVVLALGSGRGAPAEPVVAIGDEVQKGQLVARPAGVGSTAVHASTSGRVTRIDIAPYPTMSHVEEGSSITITSDGRHASAPLAPDWPADRAGRIDRIAAGGIVGLGGAAFPTSRKLDREGCGLLVVNGAECEPYISCDDMLMREHAGDIVAGTAIMADILSADRCIIAIERDKPEAIVAIRRAIDAAADDRIGIAEIPTIYPAGGERQLIDVLTGVEVPTGRYPADVGIVCQNVGTAFAVARLAATGEPLTSRIVTVTGAGVAAPGNVEVPIGAPIGELIEFCNGYRGQPEALIHGGSMMGYALPTDTLPVTRSTNCLIVAAPGEIRRAEPEWPCIRCGECVDACPARLLPQELLTAAKRGDVERLDALALDDCIECGCCDIVCPSLIPLTQTFRDAKRAIGQARRHHELSARSAERFRRHEERARAAAAAEAERQQSLIEKIDDPAARRDEIAAAVERARARRASDRHRVGEPRGEEHGDERRDGEQRDRQDGE